MSRTVWHLHSWRYRSQALAAGCGGSGGGGGGAAGSSDVTGSITITGVWTGDEQKAFQAVLDGVQRRSTRT